MALLQLFMIRLPLYTNSRQYS